MSRSILGQARTRASVRVGCSFRMLLALSLQASMFALGVCRLCVCCNCTYRDKVFPMNSVAIGKWKGKTPQQIEEEIIWKRISDICVRSGEEGAKLFSAGDIHPNDICQGQLGDCWLMSACACLAGQRGAIQRCFLTREYNAYGKYKVRLFDGARTSWSTVVIDDWIPCSRQTGQPVFAKPRGDEAWVLLLEKAMAKYKGSYGALDGGSTLWALEALTGDYVFKFKLESSSQVGRGRGWREAPVPVWKRYDLVHPKDGRGETLLGPTPDVLSPEEMFETMLFYSRRRSVIAASSGSGSDTQSVKGIVQGHAYSIVAVKEVDGFQLVRLRNPWGTFEWQGAWGDSSPLWEQYPKVRRALDWTRADDGSFWMSWQDVQASFRCLDFCMRSTGWEELRIDIHEEHPCCGPTLGCLGGCCTFWCCCQGCRALCFGKEGRKFERAPQGCCANCVAGC
ncbi:hypothetical protein QJQ45_027147 [Haematococcus lacustris]|nr:hypothetical protein QJQ45_027147 [Haematococcus lacustris]